MKHNYLYIECGEVVDTSTRFFRVPIGASKRENGFYLRLVALSQDKGHYFVLWDGAADEFYHRCLQSIGRDDMIMGNFKFPELVTPRELILHLEKGATIFPPSHVLDNQHRLLSQLSVNYRILSRRK